MTRDNDAIAWKGTHLLLDNLQDFHGNRVVRVQKSRVYLRVSQARKPGGSKGGEMETEVW